MEEVRSVMVMDFTLHWVNSLNCASPVKNISELADCVFFTNILEHLNYVNNVSSLTQHERQKVIQNFVKVKYKKFDTQVDFENEDDLLVICYVILIEFTWHPEITLKKHLCNLDETIQQFLASFLDEVSHMKEDLHQSDIKKSLQLVMSGIPTQGDRQDDSSMNSNPGYSIDTTPISIPRKRSSALQQFLQSPSSQKKQLQYQQREISRLQTELEAEMNEKLDLDMKAKAEIKQLRSQLEVKCSENEKLKETLKSLELEINGGFLEEVNAKLKNENKDLKAKIRELEEYSTSINVRLGSEYADNDRIKEKNVWLMKQADEMKKNTAILQETILKNNAFAESLEAKLRAHEEQITVLSEDNSILKEKLNEMKLKPSEGDKRVTSDNTQTSLFHELEFEQMKETIESLTISKDQLKIKIDDMTSQNLKLVENHNRLREELEYLKNRNRSLSSEMKNVVLERDEALLNLQCFKDTTVNLEYELNSKKADLNVYINKNNKLLKEKENLEMKLNDDTALLEAVTNEKSDLEARYNTLMESVNNDKQLLEKLSTENKQYSRKIITLEFEINDMKNEKNKLIEAIESLNTEKLEQETKISGLQMDKKNMQHSMEELEYEKQNEIVCLKLKLSETTTTKELMKTKIEKLNKVIESLNTEKLQQETKINDLKHSMEELERGKQDEIDRLNLKMSEFTSTIELMKTKKESISKELQTVQNTINQIKTVKKQLSSSNKNLKEELIKLKTVCNVQNNKLNQSFIDSVGTGVDLSTFLNEDVNEQYSILNHNFEKIRLFLQQNLNEKHNALNGNVKLQNELSNTKKKMDDQLCAISEITSKLEALEREHSDLKENYRISLNQLKELSAEKEEFIKKNIALSKQIVHEKDKYSALCSELQGFIERQQSLEINFNDLQSQFEAMKTKINVGGEAHNRTTKTANLIANLEEKENKINELNQAVSDLKKRNASLEVKRTLASARTELQDQIRHLNFESKPKIDELSRILNVLTKDCETKNADLLMLSNENAKLKQKNMEVLSDMMRIAEELESAKTKIKKLEMANKYLMAEVESLKCQLSETINQLEYMDREKDEALEAKLDVENKLHLITDLSQNIKKDSEIELDEQKAQLQNLKDENNNIKKELKKVTEENESLKTELSEEIKRRLGHDAKNASSWESKYNEVVDEKAKLIQEKFQTACNSGKRLNERVPGLMHENSLLKQNEKMLKDELNKRNSNLERMQSENKRLQLCLSEYEWNVTQMINYCEQLTNQWKQIFNLYKHCKERIGMLENEIFNHKNIKDDKCNEPIIKGTENEYILQKQEIEKLKSENNELRKKIKQCAEEMEEVKNDYSSLDLEVEHVRREIMGIENESIRFHDETDQSMKEIEQIYHIKEIKAQYVQLQQDVEKMPSILEAKMKDDLINCCDKLTNQLDETRSLYQKSLMNKMSAFKLMKDENNRLKCEVEKTSIKLDMMKEIEKGNTMLKQELQQKEEAIQEIEKENNKLREDIEHCVQEMKAKLKEYIQIIPSTLETIGKNDSINYCDQLMNQADEMLAHYSKIKEENQMLTNEILALKNVKDDNDNLKFMVDQISKELDLKKGIENENIELKQVMEKIESENNELRKEMIQDTHKMEDLINEYRFLDEEVESIRKEMVAVKTESVQLHEETSQNIKDIVELKNENMQLKAKTEKLLNNIKERNAEYILFQEEVQKMFSILERDEKNDLLNYCDQLTSELEVVTVNYKNNKEENQILTNKILTLQNVENENVHLKCEVDRISKEIDLLHTIQNENTVLKLEIEQCSGEMEDIKNENIELREEIKQGIRELEDINNRYSQLDQQVEHMGSETQEIETENIQLKEQIHQSVKEIVELINENIQLKQKTDQLLNNLKELEANYIQFQEKVEKMVSNLETNEKNDVINYCDQLTNQLEVLTAHHKTSKEKNRMLTNKILTLKNVENENVHLKCEVDRISKEIDLVNGIKNENTVLKLEIEKSLREMEDINNENIELRAEIENGIQEIKEISNKYSLLDQEVHLLRNETREIETQSIQLREQTDQSEKVMEEMENENTNLKQKANQLLHNIQQLEANHIQFQDEVKKMVSILETNEKNDLIHYCDQLTNQLEEMTSIYKQCKEKNHMLLSDISTLEKLKYENVHLKHGTNQISKKLNQIKGVEKENVMLLQKVEQMLKEIDRLKCENVELREQIKQDIVKMKEIEPEYCQLQENIKCMSKEMAKIKTENIRLSEESGQSLKKIVEMETENLRLKEEIEQRSENVKAIEVEHARLQKEVEEMASYLKVTKEYENLQHLCDTLQMKNSYLEKEVESVCHKLKDKELECNKLIEELKSISKKFQYCNDLNHRLREHNRRRIRSENETLKRVKAADELIDELKMQMHMLENKNTRLDSELLQQNHEINNLRINYRQQIEQYENEIQTLNNEKKMVHAKVEAMTKKMEHVKDNMITEAKLIKQVENLRAENRACIEREESNLQKLVNDHLSQLNDKNEELHELELEKEKLTREIQLLTETCDKNKFHMAQLEKQNEKLKELYERTCNQLKKKDDADFEDIMAENDSLKREYKELEKKMNEERQRFLKNAESVHAKLNKKIYAEYEKKLENAKAEHMRLVTQKCNNLKKEWMEKEERYKTMLKNEEDHIKDLSSQLWDINDKYLRLKQELDFPAPMKFRTLSEDNLCSPSASRRRVSAMQLRRDNIDSDRRLSNMSTKSESIIPQFRRRTLLTTSGKRFSLSSARVFPTEDEEGEVFDNACLAEIRKPPSPIEDINKRLTILQARNSLCPPHLKSCYPGETQFLTTANIKEDDIKLGLNSCDNSDENLLPNERLRKKRNQTSYQKPGPPTPSKNVARTSQPTDAVSPRTVLREINDGASGTTARRRSFTPKIFGSLFTTRGTADVSTAPPTRHEVSGEICATMFLVTILFLLLHFLQRREEVTE